MAKEYRYIKNKINKKVVDVNVDFLCNICSYMFIFIHKY